jgi:hypothetical protein
MWCLSESHSMKRCLTSLLCLAALACFLRADEPRKPHPFAPSIPELSEEDEKKLDAVIDRFILYDTGKLATKAEAQQAVRDFAKLGPESIPALIRGLRRAADINHSCPVTVIAAKLSKFLAASTDYKLLDFVRDEIAGIGGGSPHRTIIQDLRFGVTQRRNVLARAGVVTAPKPNILKSLSTAKLLENATKERGENLRYVLAELGTRTGDEVIVTLGLHAASTDKETQTAGRHALVAALMKLKPEEVKKKLSDEKAEMRLAAVKVARTRGYRWGSELIERLNDEDANVREWAQTALIKMAGVDYGPELKGASQDQRLQAASRWREWWEKQK